MSSEEGSAFFGKGCCENVRMPSGKEKEDWRDFSKIGCQVLLSKEVVLGHPCVRSLSVSFFIEKELHKQLRMKRKRKGEKIGERDTSSACEYLVYVRLRP